MENLSEIKSDIFRENIERKIWTLLRQTKYYIIEDDYTETEWKDMIAEHYIHTKYKVESKVVRVHLFNDNREEKEAYLGCFTLRKINNSDMILSFIYPNWKVLCLEKQNFNNCYLVTAKKKIHIYAEEIEILTTPYFVQDGSVTCCAHASILMMSHFLNLRFGYKKIRISEIAQGYLRREKQYPTKGLIPEQIMEVLTNNGVYIRPYNLSKRRQYKEKAEDVKETIKAHLRSELPVLLGINKHAVLIIGFQENAEGDNILFYDDSGVLIHNINKEKYEGIQKEYDNFIYSCSWKYILNFVEENPEEVVRFLIPFHEKVYVNYDDIFCRSLVLERNIGLENSDGEVYILKNKRFFIADNVECKKFINENVLDREFVADAVDEFICREQPHYLWCYEFEFDNEIFIIFVNSTYNMDTMENNIYINKNREPFHVSKHFHTVAEIKTIEWKEEMPLFTNRGKKIGGILEKDVLEKMASKAPRNPLDRQHDTILKVQENKSTISEEEKKKKRKKH